MPYLSEHALAALEARLGVTFRDRALLERALTHRSFRAEGADQPATQTAGKPVPSNERLEFLGDAILHAVIATHLFTAHPDWSEGELTKVKAVAVSEATLSQVGRDLGLGEFLLLGKGEEQNGGRERASLLADAVEALIAAMFVDRGGTDRGRFPVPQFVLSLLQPSLEAIEHDGLGADYKTMLQERFQESHKVPPTYHVTSDSGPDHDKTFVVEARLGGQVLGAGRGRSKKEAEQSAARDAMERLDTEP